MAHGQGNSNRNNKVHQERHQESNNRNNHKSRSDYRPSRDNRGSYRLSGETNDSFMRQNINFEGLGINVAPKEKKYSEKKEHVDFLETREPRDINKEGGMQQRDFKNTLKPASPRNFFVFDIETIPCVETARSFLNLSPEINEEEVLSQLTAYHNEITNGQNDFFRQLFHKVVCISFIAGTIHPMKGGREKYIIKSLKTGGRKGETEEEILRGVFTFLQKHPSRLISFNGRGFDLPVLQYRAMKYGIEAKWIYNDGYYNYNHRYSIEKHCDLLDMFSNFGASARVKISEVASLLNIPSKLGSVNGSDVFPMFKEGKLEEICNYCEHDVITTFIMYIRFMQHAGKVSGEGYNIIIDNLLTLLKSPEAPSHHVIFVEEFLKRNKGNPHISVSNTSPDKETDSSSSENTQEKEGISSHEFENEEISDNQNIASENSKNYEDFEDITAYDHTSSTDDEARTNAEEFTDLESENFDNSAAYAPQQENMQDNKVDEISSLLNIDENDFHKEISEVNFPEENNNTATETLSNEEIKKEK